MLSFRTSASVLLSALLIAGAWAQEAPPKPITPADLDGLKKDALTGKGGDFEKPLSRRNSLSADDEKAVLAFLDRESRDPGPPEDERSCFDLGRLYTALVQLLGRHGSSAVVSPLVGLIHARNTGMEHLWCYIAPVLVEIADRHPIQEEALKPLSEGKDPSDRELARQILECIRYEGLKADPQQAVAGHVHELARQKAIAGTVTDWRETAMHRGMLMEGNKPEEIRRFIEDCKRRIRGLQDSINREELDSQPGYEMVAREMVAEWEAFEELVRIEGAGSFDSLVGMLESGDPEGWALANCHLYQLTGQTFPWAHTIIYGNHATNVLLNRKAAAAWRKWKAGFGERGIPVRVASKEKPGAAAGGTDVDLEKRLAEFQFSRGRRTGPEFARPVDDVLGEMLLARDRRLLDLLSDVLATKTLTDAQVTRLIDASKSSDSEAHRIVLWKTLFTSQSAAARRHLQTVLTAETDEGTLLQLIPLLSGYRSGEVPLLTYLFATHKSAAVKDALIKLASTQDYSTDRDENAQDELLRGLYERADGHDRKIRLLETAYGRAGVNRGGRKLVEEALDEETEPRTRKAIFAMLLRRYGNEWVSRLLDGSEVEEVKIEGLKAYRSSLEREDVVFSFAREDDVRPLREAADKDSSMAVRKAAGEIVGLLRGRSVKMGIRRFTQMAESIEEMAAHPRGGEGDEEMEDLPDEYRERMWSRMDPERQLDEILGELKETFGDLPEEEAIRRETKPAADRMRAALEKLKAMKKK